MVDANNSNVGNETQAPETNNTGSSASNLEAIMDRISTLENAIKDKKEDVSSMSEGKEKGIESYRVKELEDELEAMKHTLEDQKEQIIIEAEKTIQLKSMMSNVLSDKKELLEASLSGKTLDEKLEFLDKHRTMFMMPDTDYKSSGMNTGKSNNEELSMLMKSELIQESGLTEKEVSNFLEDSDVKTFEKRLLRDYRGIRTSDDVISFFKTGVSNGK